MKLMEYQARETFDRFNIPVMNAAVINNLNDIDAAIEGLNYPLVVKAQVQVGGRGKAGGIQFANDIIELRSHCEKLLFADIKGYQINHLMIVEKAEYTKELYLSIMLDRLSKKPMIIFSANGGVDIEETAEKNPEAIVKLAIDPMIGIREYDVHYLVGKSGVDKNIVKPLFTFLTKLYKMFIETDAMLAEINPLIITKDNRLIALDGKVDIDDSALYRQKTILAYRDQLHEEDLVLEARKYRFLYIPIEDGGNIGVISNGSGMLMSSIDLISKDDMSVGAALDLGGGATADRIKEAVRIILMNKDIKFLYINIFGGITRCDEVARGVKEAMTSTSNDYCVIVRLEGTNKDEGKRIIQSIGDQVISVNGLVEGVAELSQRRIQS